MTPISFSVGFALILTITLGIYLPGLSGEFLLDDIPNLEPLGEFPNENLLTRFKRFILVGYSSFLGRPLSLATFWLNDQAWPSIPRIFKLTNIWLHLLVGTLLAWCLILLCSIDTKLKDREKLAIALATTAVWLLHPFNVSTVLYVVQRMSQLAGLFILVGLLGYLKGRLLVLKKPTQGFIVMTMSVALAGTLGVLCKENAALLPIFILSAEYTLIRGNNVSVPQGWRIWSTVMLLFPLLLLLSWHVVKFSSMYTGYNVRPYTMTERLMTQTRVLWDYVGNTLAPRRIGTGLHHDDFVISTSLLAPVTTLIAFIAIVVVLCLAISYRKKLPVFGFAVFWFLGGHLLESGVAPLEIYFEHRNYIPMIGPLFALIYGIFRLPKKIGKYSTVFAGSFIVICSVSTWQNTTLWGNTALMAELWADEHPQSFRAQQFSADQWAMRGNFDYAYERIQKLISLNPNNATTQIQSVQIKCLQGQSNNALNFDSINNSLRNGVPDFATPKTIDRIITLFLENKCQDLTKSQVLNMVAALLENKKTHHQPKIMAHLHYTRAKFHAEYSDFRLASDDVEQALSYDRLVDLALFQTSLLLAQKRYEEAVQSVALAKTLDRHPTLGIPMRSAEISEWEKFVAEELEKNKRNAID